MKNIFLLALALLPLSSYAQNASFGIMLGASNYQGDLSERHITVVETHLAGGIFVRRQILPKLTVKGNFYAGRISGDDANYADRLSRGYKYSSPLLEGGVNLEWDILGRARNVRRGYYTKVITPYLLSGFGAVYFNPDIQGLPPDAEEKKYDTRNFNFIIPLGAGFKADLNPQITLGLEFVTHLPFTDYLDGVSESAEPGNHDWYGFAGLTIQYWFDAPVATYKKEEW
jgi:OmpA-OmpF porin, OOP family